MEMVSNYSMKEVVNKHSRVIESITNSLKGIISHSDDALNEERLLGLVENTVFESRYISLIDYDEITDVIKAIFLRVSSKYSILSNYIEDPSINEIMVNGYNRIFVEKNKKITEVDNSFYSDDELEGLIRMFASDIHREINEAHPIVDARLENGYRVNGVLKNVALNGPILTIRKFANDEITLDDLVNNDTMPRECSDFLTKLVAAKYNIFISGGTSSGKTTFLNTLVGIKDFDGEIYFNYTYKDIAYVSQKQVIDWYLNVEDNIRMEEIFSNTKDEELFNKIVELLELKDIAQYKKVDYIVLNNGTEMKFGNTSVYYYNKKVKVKNQDREFEIEVDD